MKRKNILNKITLYVVCAMLISTSVVVNASGSGQMVHISLWNAVSDKPSMGNISTDNNPQALYDPIKNTLQIATNPVDISGYRSGITAAKYATTKDGKYEDVKTLSINTIETGTKNDGANHTVRYLSSFEIEIPSYIKKDGIEYIPFKMKVPHTPMDVVVGTGYLDARLRINWNEVESTDADKIMPNKTISTGKVSKIDLTDDLYGISISADSTIIHPDSTIRITQNTNGDNYRLAKKALGNVSFDLYNISITCNGQAQTPKGSLMIKFPYKGKLKLYRINEGGSKTVLRGTSSSKDYTILSRSAGLFAIVGGEKTYDKKQQVIENRFKDITNHWARNSILKSVEKGFFAGTDENTFSPDSNMTNAMIITVLYRMADTPKISITDLPNVEKNSYYEKAAAWCYKNNIIGKYYEFYPNKDVTREEFASMLYEYNNIGKSPEKIGDLNNFTDKNKVSSWAADALSWANTKGIVTGTTKTTISPHSSATRAMIATMICRYLNMEEI